jgi:hypothetical protein
MNSKTPFFLLSLAIFLAASGSSFAGAGQTLKCAVGKGVDRIVSIEVGETDLEGQIVARTDFAGKDRAAGESIQRVSNGSITDHRIYLYETGEFGVGTTHRYLEKNRKNGTYSISHYFQCDWINHEETCSPGAELEFRGTAADASCELVND